MHVNYIKFERHAWPYPPCINCMLIYKMPYPSHRFDDAGPDPAGGGGCGRGALPIFLNWILMKNA